MTRATIVRRTLTLFLVCAAVVAGLGAIRVAADWTASAAPLEASPIAADELRARLAAEQDRSGILEERLATLTDHAEQLQAALSTAQARLDADTTNAQGLAAQLAAAKQKLAALERSIRQAQSARGSAVTTAAATGRAGAPSGEIDDD